MAETGNKRRASDAFSRNFSLNVLKNRATIELRVYARQGEPRRANISCREARS
jgi:hypothetical protein